MTEPDSPHPAQPSAQPAKAHRHIFRTFIAAVFGSIALFLILLSILAIWLNQTLTNTSVYVSTVAPLAAQPAIQNYVTQKVTSQLMTAGSVQDLASNLLPASEIAHQTVSQETPEVQAVISQSVSQIVSSPTFAGLWKSANQSTQVQLIQELNSNSATITLDLHPVILNVFDLLNTTKLAAINSHVQLPSNVGNLNLNGSVIPKIHTAYTYFKDGTWVLLAITLFCIGICIWASVHHLKTLRRILIGTGILSLLLAVILKTPSFILSSQDRSGLEQQAILAVVNTLLAKLFMTCLILGIVCIAAAIASKLYSKFIAHKKSVSHEHPKTVDTTDSVTAPA